MSYYLHTHNFYKSVEVKMSFLHKQLCPYKLVDTPSYLTYHPCLPEFKALGLFATFTHHKASHSGLQDVILLNLLVAVKIPTT